MSTDTAIKLENVSKKFCKSLKKSMFYGVKDIGRNVVGLSSRSDRLRKDEFWAVDDVSFEVKKGEALGIIGPNGSGKTTLLKMLNGIFWPDKGKISVKGKVGALIAVGAGFHPQLTGRENIYVNGAIMGINKREINKKFDSIVEFADIGNFLDMPVKYYSSGMFVRLGFAVAIHCDPDILLIDEVLSVGDFRFRKKCIQKMQEFIKNGTPIVFVSHNLPSVIELCPKTMLLNKGEILKIGESRKVVHDYYRAWGDNNRVKEGVLKLKKVELLGSSGEPRNTFNAGEVGIFSAEFYSELELKDIAVAFSVKREDGLVLFDSHSAMTSDKTYHFYPGEHKKIQIIFRTALPQGSYYIGTYLQQPDEEIHFYNDELLQFYVVAPKLSAPSYTFLEVNWK